MPVLSKFYGMTVKMYFQQKEHNPPHVHVLYDDCMGAIDIKTRTMMEGDLPARALKMAAEWIARYEAELLEMWQTQEFRKLPPLE